MALSGCWRVPGPQGGDVVLVVGKEQGACADLRLELKSCAVSVLISPRLQEDCLGSGAA